jgi:hypothetical protein
VPEYCRCTPAEWTPFFQKPGLLRDHHPGRVAQLIQHGAAQVIAHRIGVPAGEVAQPLHPVRAQVPGLLSDRPRVLAFGAREQPEQLQPCPAPRLHLREPARHQPEHVLESGPPPREAIINYPPGRGHRVSFKI